MIAQHFVDAISLGSLYALAVLGIALILGVMKLINFAHGDLIMVGGYAMSALSPYPWPFLILGTLVATMLLAMLMERVAFRPVRGASAATLLITSFTVSYLLQNIMSATLTSNAQPVTMPMFVLELFTIGDVRIQKLGVLTVGITLALVTALALGLKWTTIGLHMRSAAEDFGMAQLLGVRANRVIAVSFAISGFLAGVVSLIFMSQTGAVVPTTGISITLVAFVGTVVGGMGNLAAATAGGFLLGVMTVILQVVLPLHLSPFRDAFVFSLVIAILLLRPQGLLQRHSRRQVLQ
jgi:branched-chain amino acid transport system permease protein